MSIARTSPLGKAAADQARLAALGARHRRRRLSGGGLRHDRGELAPGLGRPAARRAVLRGVLSAGFFRPPRRHRQRHPRKPLDDRGLNGDRHRDIGPGGHRCCKKYRAAAGLLFLPRHPGGIAQLPGDHPGDLLRQAVRLRPVRRRRHAVVRHNRLLRQAARRRHRGHGFLAGRSRARDRRRLAAMDQLRHPAAGDAAHDRARPLPLRYQLPRIRSDRHRRRRRHRRDARHRVQPLRIPLRRRHPAGHHRHRDALEYSSGYIRRWVQ